MSGQPNRKPADAERFRAEYMQSLGLMADINAMNLEANQTYLSTGQLPAVSQMSETRTTSEILADVEKIKAGIVSDLKLLGSSDFALAVVQAIQKSPLNTGGSLLTFFAQRAPEIVSNVKKQYKYGIKGDANDVRQFVNFVEDMYNKTKSFAGSVKSYFNRPSEASVSVVKFGDFSRLGEVFDDLSRILLLKMRDPKVQASTFGVRERGLLPYETQIIKTKEAIDEIKELLSYDDFIHNTQLFLDSQTKYAGNKDFDGLIDDIFSAYKEYNEVIEGLPKIDTLYSLLDQLDSALKNSDLKLAFKILIEFSSQIILFHGVYALSSRLENLERDYREFVSMHENGLLKPITSPLSPEQVGPIATSGAYNASTLPTQMKGQEVKNQAEIEQLKDDITHNEGIMRQIEGDIGNVLDEIDRISQAKKQLIGRPKSEVEDLNNKYGGLLMNLKAELDSLNSEHVGLQEANKDLIRRLGVEQEHSSELVNERLNPLPNMPLRKPPVRMPEPEPAPEAEEPEAEEEQYYDSDTGEWVTGKRPSVSKPKSKYSDKSLGDLEEEIKDDINRLDEVNKRLRIETLSDEEISKFKRLYNDILEDMEEKVSEYKKFPKSEHDKERGRYKLLERIDSSHTSIGKKIRSLTDDVTKDQESIMKLETEKSKGVDEKRLKQIRGEQAKLTKRINKNKAELGILREEFGKLENLLELISGGINGHGLPKRRGRPKGSGIGKRKTYKEIVKAHTAEDKGIEQTPRFVKFGRYLINTQKLNDGTLAIKQPSGGSILGFPSTRISKNMSSVIKKMIGGGMPSYAELSKLSEPEKAYLHKISSKANILDKFSIPAPDKDKEEKDIHDFEVMKGEIMAGNDSKELIKKFKLHLIKLSRNGTLPKKEAQEVMEELINLGF